MTHHLSLAANAGPCWLVLLLAGLGPLPLPVSAQPAKADKATPVSTKEKPKAAPLIDRLRSPYEADRPVAEKLRTPRKALETFYYAVIMYDIFPEMIADAVACLDLDEVRPSPDAAAAAMMALDLENILDSLALPLSGVPDETVGESVVLHDAGEVSLSMRRGADGGWRFNARTL